MNFEIDKKQIEIFYNETENKKIPVIILNTFSEYSLFHIPTVFTWPNLENPFFIMA